MPLLLCEYVRNWMVNETKQSIELTLIMDDDSLYCFEYFEGRVY